MWYDFQIHMYVCVHPQNSCGLQKAGAWWYSELWCVSGGERYAVWEWAPSRGWNSKGVQISQQIVYIHHVSISTQYTLNTTYSRGMGTHVWPTTHHDIPPQIWYVNNFVLVIWHKLISLTTTEHEIETVICMPFSICYNIEEHNITLC